MSVGRRCDCGIWAERFRHQELTPVLLFNEVYSLGDGGKALNLKTSLRKWGGRRTSKRRMCQVHVLLSFAAKLQISGCGKKKETPFVYVKHQVCRVGKWEWRAGWRIFFCVFGLLFPMSSECSREALARGGAGASSILRYFLSMAQHTRQKKKAFKTSLL